MTKSISIKIELVEIDDNKVVKSSSLYQTSLYGGKEEFEKLENVVKGEVREIDTLSSAKKPKK